VARPTGRAFKTEELHRFGLTSHRSKADIGGPHPTAVSAWPEIGVKPRPVLTQQAVCEDGGIPCCGSSTVQAARTKGNRPAWPFSKCVSPPGAGTVPHAPGSPRPARATPQQHRPRARRPSASRADAGVADVLAAGAFGPGLPQSTSAGRAGGVSLIPVNCRAFSLASPAGRGRIPAADSELPEVGARHGPNRQRPSRAPPGPAWSVYPSARRSAGTRR
jgi:hypothetical protein